MLTFFFKNNNNVEITIIDSSFEKAYLTLVKVVKHPADFECENPDGLTISK